MSLSVGNYLALKMSGMLGRTHSRKFQRLIQLVDVALLGIGNRMVCTATGLKLNLNPAAYSDSQMINGLYSIELMTLLGRVVNPGDRVIDVGAQLGYITCHLAKRVGPTGKIYSFEPDPNALRRLRLAVEANQFDWVRIFPVGASNVAGTATIHLSKHAGYSSLVESNHSQHVESAEISTVRIDDLAANGEFESPIALVKMDVEGWESSVLDGMQALIAKDRPLILTEINPEMLAVRGEDSRNLLSRIAPHGYAIFEIMPFKIRPSADLPVLERFDPNQDVKAEMAEVLCVPEEKLPALKALGVPISEGR